jgi:hypothetical protein
MWGRVALMMPQYFISRDGEGELTFWKLTQNVEYPRPIMRISENRQIWDLFIADKFPEVEDVTDLDV